MKKLLFPFQIGKHYENWEFDLEILDNNVIRGFDSYTYLKKILFLGVKPAFVELTFSSDVLRFVTLKINLDSLEQLKFIRDILESNFQSQKIHNEIIKFESYTLKNNNDIIITLRTVKLRSILIYGSRKYLTNSNILILLC